MMSHYTKRANQRILTRLAMDKLIAAEIDKPRTQRGGSFGDTIVFNSNQAFRKKSALACRG
jgi:hypothetical protein